MAFDRAGQLLVVDTDNKRVQIWTQCCDYVSEFLVPTQPQSVSVHKDGRIFVGDRDSVFVFAFSA